MSLWGAPSSETATATTRAAILRRMCCVFVCGACVLCTLRKRAKGVVCCCEQRTLVVGCAREIQCRSEPQMFGECVARHRKESNCLPFTFLGKRCAPSTTLRHDAVAAAMGLLIKKLRSFFLHPSSVTTLLPHLPIHARRRLCLQGVMLLCCCRVLTQTCCG